MNEKLKDAFETLCLLVVIAMVFIAVTGCASLNQANSAVLQQGKPIGMWDENCQGYVVQSGLPVPCRTADGTAR